MQRPSQPRDGLLAGAAVGDDLGDHRVEFGRDFRAFLHAAVDADARATWRSKDLHKTRTWGEVALAVLGAEASLDGPAMGSLRRGVHVVEADSAGDVELRMDEIDALDELGDRVFDLQPRVHFQKVRAVLARVVKELGGAGASVAGFGGQSCR